MIVRVGSMKEASAKKTTKPTRGVRAEEYEASGGLEVGRPTTVEVGAPPPETNPAENMPSAAAVPAKAEHTTSPTHTGRKSSCSGAHSLVLSLDRKRGIEENSLRGPSGDFIQGLHSFRNMRRMEASHCSLPARAAPVASLLIECSGGAFEPRLGRDLGRMRIHADKYLLRREICLIVPSGNSRRITSLSREETRVCSECR
jgi:hypothetical protein